MSAVWAANMMSVAVDSSPARPPSRTMSAIPTMTSASTEAMAAPLTTHSIPNTFKGNGILRRAVSLVMAGSCSVIRPSPCMPSACSDDEGTVYREQGRFRASSLLFRVTDT